MNLRDYVTRVTSDLVKINSENPPGREKEVAEYVIEKLKELGLMKAAEEVGI